tara:strand:- start:198 stop:1205 length:1008 start_codon:yes stop_codon:yes gene_type:complete
MICHRVITLLFLLFLVSCASISSYSPINKEGFEEKKEIQEQSKFLVSSMAKASRKLHDIAWPIMISNIDACQNSRINAFGLMVAHTEDLPKSLRPFFYAASPNTFLNNINSDLPMIVSIAKNSPADRANIMEGDLIISINNSIVSYKNYRSLLEDAAKKGSLIIKIKRLEEEILYQLVSESICGYPVQAMISPIPNAYADGSKIYITIATLDFVKDDQEIAFLIGHELAHNIYHYKGDSLFESQGNPIAIKEKPSLQKITDLLILQTEEKETEADLYGVEFAIKAGIAQDKVANYFRRLTIYMPVLMKDSFFRMHPGNAKRVADIERKLKELKDN